MINCGAAVGIDDRNALDAEAFERIGVRDCSPWAGGRIVEAFAGRNPASSCRAL
jgi:hypothetical protein